MARTWLFDKLILEQIGQGADLVLNLAAGLDARPYRLPLPASLHWVEVDLPPLLAYKENILSRERPVCRLERVALDLSNLAERRAFFRQLSAASQHVLVVSEGLVIYLTPEEVGVLAADLAAPPSFQRWILDFTSPTLLAMLQHSMGQSFDQARIPFKFGPAQGVGFFEPHGWQGLEAHSFFHTAARLGRLSFVLRFVARFLTPSAFAPNRPWGGVAVLGRL